MKFAVCSYQYVRQLYVLNYCGSVAVQFVGVIQILFSNYTSEFYLLF